MTLKQLEAFFWAARLGSFGLAAERLYTTQSSLSKRIAELESDLGESLFDRSGPRAKVTDAGMRLFDLAARMLELQDDIRASMHTTRALRGVCRFGIGEFVIHTCLPALVARVRKDYPAVVLEPYVGLAKTLMTRVAQGELDFAIMPAPSKNASVIAEPLPEVELIWTAAPGLVGDSKILTREMLERHSVIVMSQGSGLTMALDNWAVTHGLKFQRIITTSSMSAVAALTVAGLGLCQLAAGFVRPLIERGQLVELRCKDPMPACPTLPYFLHSRKEDTRWLLRAIKPLAIEEANFQGRSVLLP